MVVTDGRREDILTASREFYSDTARLEIVVSLDEQAKCTQRTFSVLSNANSANSKIDSPNAAIRSTHIIAWMTALNPFHKVTSLGGIFGNIEVIYVSFMMKIPRTQGSYGNLKMDNDAGLKIIDKYGLDEIDEAMKRANNKNGYRKQVLLIPGNDLPQ
ncbi:hypothetical protein EAF00_007708 [Botryotinia globosa]|nr:hypothetical protein EAF00_007708 [Botryotinia globosa]